jgi:hypothetical protein
MIDCKRIRSAGVTVMEIPLRITDHRTKPNVQKPFSDSSVRCYPLAALQTFLSFSERAEKHRITAVRYGAVGRQIEQFLETGGSAQKSPETLIDEIRERLNRLAEESPVLPPDIVRQATIDSLKPIRGGETAQK